MSKNTVGLLLKNLIDSDSCDISHDKSASKEDIKFHPGIEDG